MSKLHVFSSCALNYVPKARLLFRSLREHLPGAELHLALADDPRGLLDAGSEPFDGLLPISGLDIPSWRGWAFGHTIVELCTAIKPFALGKLLARQDCSAAIYFDPDIVAFSPLDDIVRALDEDNIVLTPHQTKPDESIAGIMDNEICSLKHGIYNLGFIGVRAGDEGRRFAEWWSRRTYYFCRDDIPNGLFTDQRWIDLAPAFFDGVRIIKSPRHNVAPWNLTTRSLTGSIQEGFQVDGHPLGFFHFTGFDSGDHEVMAAKNAPGNRATRELIAWYKENIRLPAADPFASQPWAFATFSNGERITAAQRIVYRDRADLQAAFPDPFDCSKRTGYLNWWRTQAKHEYPDLFGSGAAAAGSARPARALSPGFHGGAMRGGWRALGSHARQVLARPGHAAHLFKAALGVVKREGLAGLYRKIRGYR